MNAIVERAKARLRDASERFTEEIDSITDDRIVGAQAPDLLYKRLLSADAAWQAAVSAFDEELHWEGFDPTGASA